MGKSLCPAVSHSLYNPINKSRIVSGGISTPGAAAICPASILSGGGGGETPLAVRASPELPGALPTSAAEAAADAATRGASTLGNDGAAAAALIAAASCRILA